MTNNAVANNWVPDYYISGTQWSRVYALAYLDLKLRGSKGHQGYAASMKQFLSEVQTAAKNEHDDALIAWLSQHVEGYLGLVGDIRQYKQKFFSVIKFNATKLDCSIDGTFKSSLELNPYWAATNSFFYICHIHDVCGKGSAQDSASEARKAFRNMLFIKPVKIDPPPSSLDGYDHQVLQGIVQPGSASSAITLPSNATCC